MAQYTINHVCGHTEVHQIYGTNAHGERDRKEAWLATQPCSECRQAQREAERAEATAKATEQAAKLAMPELTGSEKQVAWALAIRATALEGLKKELVKPELAAQIVALETSAKWWIENRTFIGFAPDCLRALDKKYHDELMKIGDEMEK